MILVADAGPLRYLVLIECVDVLKPLYTRAIVPQSVALELQRPSTPIGVRTWIGQLPYWCEIHPDAAPFPGLGALGPGERSAIELAISLEADRLLMDDRLGRAEAKARQLSVTGTVGVLAEAHRHGLLDFEEALARLRQTNFYLSPELINTVRRQLSGRGAS